MNNQCFVRLPHALFGCGLRPVELAVWLQLAAHANRFGTCTVRQQAIADNIGCCRDTVNKAVKALKIAGLLSATARFRSEHGHPLRICDSYALTALSGSYARLPVEALSMGLSPSELAVYAFQFACHNHATLEAVPSLAQIAGALGVSIHTVIEANTALEARNLSYKEHYIRCDRSFGHNRYTVVTPALLRCLMQVLLLRAKQGIKKQTTRSKQAVRAMSKALIKEKNNFIVMPIVAAVKRLFVFASRGTAKSRQQEPEPPG